MAARAVVIGDALIDELRDDHGVREFVGGAALNVAVGLSRLGVPATLIAMVGDDEAGERIRSYLGTFGVELLATPSALGSSRAVSVRAGGAEPEYMFNAAAQARRIIYGEAERAAIAGASVVVISCVPLDDEAQTAELVDALAAAGGPVVIDPNPRAGMMHDSAAFVRGFERIAADASLVKVGADDAALLYGTSLDVLRERLVALGAGAVFATAGADGATIEAGGVVVSRPIATLPGPIVDTMGGGDASLAAAVASLVAGAPSGAAAWEALLERAMLIAGATCRAEGALLRLPSAGGPGETERVGT